MTDLPPTIGPKAKGASNHAADNHTAAPSREVVVLDPSNLVPGSAVLPTGVALARRSPETTQTRAPELTAALVYGDDRTLGHRAALSRLIQSAPVVPLLIADAGEQASRRYVEFFTANIRNANTRRAYARAEAFWPGARNAA